MGGGESVDGMWLSARFLCEREKAADVVVLVKSGEETVCFFDRKTKIRKRDGIPEGVNEIVIAVYQLMQRKERCATRRFRGHGIPRDECNKKKRGSNEVKEARRWVRELQVGEDMGIR